MSESLLLAFGFHRICLGQDPPEVTRRHDGAWLLCGRGQPWPLDEVEMLGEAKPTEE